MNDGKATVLSNIDYAVMTSDYFYVYLDKFPIRSISKSE